MGAAKFTFDTVFEAHDDVVSDAARSRKRITLTQGELDGMLSLARNEGISGGTVRAAEETARAARDAVAAIAGALTRLDTEVQSVREQAAQVALAAARKLAHGALENFATAEVETTLREAMHQAIGEPRITLRAATGVVEALQSRMTEIAHEEGFDGRVQISSEPRLTNADCRIEWRGGGSERSEAAIEAALDALIARRFSNFSALKG
jgi:flagellar assembly protein FliH